MAVPRRVPGHAARPLRREGREPQDRGHDGSARGGPARRGAPPAGPVPARALRRRPAGARARGTWPRDRRSRVRQPRLAAAARTGRAGEPARVLRVATVRSSPRPRSERPGAPRPRPDVARFPLPHRGCARRRHRSGSRRLGDGEPDELLPLVVDPGRRAAAGRRGRRAPRPREAGRPGPAHDGRPESAAPGDRVLRSVAGLLPLRPVSRDRHGTLPRVHRGGEGVDVRRSRLHLRVHRQAGAAREGDPARGLRVLEQDARRLLRDRRQPGLSRPRRARRRRAHIRPRRGAAAGIGAHHDVGAAAHEPRQARGLGPAAHPRHADAASPARRGQPAGGRQGLRRADAAREAGAAQARRALLLVPPAHRPAGLPARGLRRRGPQARELRRRHARRPDGRVQRRLDDRRVRWAANIPAEPGSEGDEHPGEEDAGLRARTQPAGLRSAADPRDERVGGRRVVLGPGRAAGDEPAVPPSRAHRGRAACARGAEPAAAAGGGTAPGAESP